MTEEIKPKIEETEKVSEVEETKVVETPKEEVKVEEKPTEIKEEKKEETKVEEKKEEKTEVKEEKKEEDKPSTEEHMAKAKAKDLSISTKHCIEICSYLRYKTTAFSKKFLEEVIAIKKPVPFKKFKKDIGHKAGMAAGRFPEKAAKEVLKLIQSVEANAQNKGLNTSSLKIIKMLANRAAVPVTGGRHRTGTKRTHLEIEVKEVKEKKKERKEKKKEVKKEAPKPKQKEEKKEVKEAPVSDKKMEEKPEPKTEAPKVEENNVEEEKVPSTHELAKSKPEGEQSK